MSSWTLCETGSWCDYLYFNSLRPNKAYTKFSMYKIHVQNSNFGSDDDFSPGRHQAMGLLPDTWNCGLHMRRNAGNVFPTTDLKRNR